jgi:hypothetical protein
MNPMRKCSREFLERIVSRTLHRIDARHTRIARLKKVCSVSRRMRPGGRDRRDRREIE